MKDTEAPVKTLANNDSGERQQSYQRLLENVPDRQFAVVIADDGDKGLSLNQTLHPDCIIVNVELPDMEGRLRCRPRR